MSFASIGFLASMAIATVDPSRVMSAAPSCCSSASVGAYSVKISAVN